MDFAKMGFQRLSYDNYETWMLRARQVLTREGLWSFVSEEAPPMNERSTEWKTKDELALQSIGFLVEDAQLRLIKDAETARDAWSLLNRYYVKDSAVGKVALIKKLSKLELAEGGDLRRHLCNFDEVFEKFENTGCRMDEDMRAAFILASLPQSYDSIVASIQGRGEVFTMPFVKSKLLEEYERRMDKSDGEKQKAMAVKTSFQYPKEENRRLCYACGSPDHIMRNCEILKSVRGESSQGAGRRKTEAAKTVSGGNESCGSICFAVLQEEEANTNWYLDSGASCHMTGRKELLSSSKRMDEEKVLMANGKAISCDMKGQVDISVVDKEGRSVTVNLKNVVVVPGLAANLVSVQAITRNGYDVLFKHGGCQIIKNGKVVIVGEKVGKLYRLNKEE